MELVGPYISLTEAQTPQLLNDRRPLPGLIRIILKPKYKYIG